MKRLVTMGSAVLLVGAVLPSAPAVARATQPAITWTPEQRWADRDIAVYEPQVALSGDGGTAVAVWMEQEGGRQDLLVSTADLRDGSRAWSEPLSLLWASETATYPNVAVSDDGSRVIVAYASTDTSGCPRSPRACRIARTSESSAVLARTATISDGVATWSAPVAIAETFTGFMATTSLAASRDLSHATVAWQRFDGTGYLTYAATGTLTGDDFAWTAPVDIDRSRYGYLVTAATSATGDRAIVAWRADEPQEIRYAVGRDLTSSPRWSVPRSLTPDGTEGNLPAIGMSSDGETAAALWMEDDPVWSLKSSTAMIGRSRTRWASPTTQLIMGPQYAGDPTIAMSGSYAVAAWSEEGGEPGIYASGVDTSAAEPVWTARALVSEPGIAARYPRVALATGGAMSFIAWTKVGGGSSAFSNGSSIGFTSTGAVAWTPVPGPGSDVRTESFQSAAISGNGSTVATAYRSHTALDGESAAVSVGMPGPMPLIESLSIDGSAAVGDTVDAVATTAGFAAPISYQWQRRGAGGYEDIRGATSPSYAVDPRDAARRIRVVATQHGRIVTSRSVLVARMEQRARGFAGLPGGLQSPGATVISRGPIRTSAGGEARVTARLVSPMARGDLGVEVRRTPRGGWAVVVPRGLAGTVRVSVVAPGTARYAPLRVSQEYAIG